MSRRYVVRISLPDRPGSLSAVAAAVSRSGGDIVSLEVVERADGEAVDDLCIEVDADPTALRQAVEQLPGIIVEALREVSGFRRADAPVELAARLVEEGSGAVARLVEGLPSALWASWAVALARGVEGIETLATSSGAPPLEGLRTPWLPLHAPRRLGPAEWMPTAWHERVVRGELALAVAPLSGGMTAVLLGRAPGPRFLASELRQLGLLGRIAVASEVAGATRRPLSVMSPASAR